MFRLCGSILLRNDIDMYDRHLVGGQMISPHPVNYSAQSSNPVNRLRWLAAIVKFPLNSRISSKMEICTPTNPLQS